MEHTPSLGLLVVNTNLTWWTKCQTIESHFKDCGWYNRKNLENEMWKVNDYEDLFIHKRKLNKGWVCKSKKMTHWRRRGTLIVTLQGLMHSLLKNIKEPIMASLIWKSYFQNPLRHFIKHVMFYPYFLIRYKKTFFFHFSTQD